MTGAGFALSPQQTRLWPSEGRAVSCVLRLSGAVPPDAVRTALEHVIASHDTWRIDYRSVAALVAPVQWVTDEPGLAWDGTEAGPSALHAALARTGGHDWELRMAASAVAADRSTLLRVAVRLAEYLRCGGTPADHDVNSRAVAYEQFADWQNDLALEGPDAAVPAGLREALASTAIARLPLSTSDDADPIEVPVRLSGDLLAGLAVRAREWAVDPVHVLAAAWRILLWRLTNAAPLVVATTFDGRPFDELADCHGRLETLAADMAVEGPGHRIAEVAAGCARRAADRAAADASPLGWERLLREQGQPAALPFGFQVLPVTDPVLEAGSVRLTLSELDDRSERRLGVTLTGWLSGDRAVLTVRGALHPAEGRLLAHRMAALLTRIVGEGDAPIDTVDLLAPEDRPAAPSAGADGRCVHHLVAAAAARNPDAIAVAAGHIRFSYAGLLRAARRLAHRLAQFGAGPERRVGLWLPRGPHTVVGMLGILESGAAVVPLDSRWPIRRVQQILGAANTVAVVTSAELAPRLAGGDSAVLALDAEGLAPRPTHRLSSPGVRPENAATVIYTSGSTGTPRGVVVEHRQLSTYLAAFLDRHGRGDLRHWAVASTEAADLSHTVIFGALAAGACLHVVDWEHGLDPDLFAETMRRDPVDVIKLVPTHLRALLTAADPADVLPGRLLVLGGEVLDGPLAARVADLAPATALVNHYGPTETTVGVTTFEVPAGTAPVPIGTPFPHVSVAVLEPAGPVPTGLPGELAIGGASVTRGYDAEPGRTAERFVPDPTVRGGRRFRTGDRVRRLPNGTLEFLGRADDQIKIRGHRVECAEVASALRGLPMVADAAVRVDTQEATPRLAAWVAPTRAALDRHGAGVTDELLAGWTDVFESTHGSLVADPARLFTNHGWNSSYTGEPLPEAEVREQVDATVDLVLRERPRRVLEIGCGTGLLMLGIVPRVEEYVGTDIAPGLLRYARDVAKLAGFGDRVRLCRQPAHQLAGLPGDCDVVVLNSVVQYFPSIDYLAEVLSGLAGMVRPGGRIVVGDVRNLRTLDAFHASVALDSAADYDELRRHAARQRARDNELVVDPDAFSILANHIGGISTVGATPKRGRARNELTDFRYDVVLRVGGEPPVPVEVSWRDWCDIGGLAGLRERLTEDIGPVLGVRGVPDVRSAGALALHRTLVEPGRNGSNRAGKADLAAAMAEAESHAVHPEAVVELAVATGWRAVPRCPSGPTAGTFDVVFTRSDRIDLAGDAAAVPPAEPVPPRPLAELATSATVDGAARTLVPALRAELAQRLPEHMVPEAIMLVPTLPLADGGKLDARRLPPISRAEGDPGQYVAPRTDAEQRVAEVFAEVLRLDRVGVEDEFFALGGHSLLAIQVIARLRQSFGCDLPLRGFFDEPATVAHLARALARTEPPAVAESAEPDDGAAPVSFAPVSFAQLRILRDPDPTHPVYNVPFAFYLDGDLDEPALRTAMDAVLARHAAWRTTFPLDPHTGERTQRIQPHATFELAVLDLRSKPTADREREATRIAGELAQSRFTLDSGPLCRGVLMRMADHRHAIALVVHHLVSDGWSTNLWCAEFAELYRAHRDGRAPLLRDLPLSYPEYSRRERRTLAGPRLATELAHWRAELAGMPHALRLPADHPYPAQESHRGDGLAFELSAELSAALRRLALAEDATLFMLLLAAWTLLLHRWSGEPEIVVGTPVAHRDRVELEPLLGCFVNFVVLRTGPGRHATFRALVREVREVSLTAFEHQDAPFAELVDQLGAPWDGPRPPLFQVMFELANAPGSTALELPGLTLAPLEFSHGTSEFELNLVMREDRTTGRLGGWLLHRTDLFTPDTVAGLLANYRALLEAIVRDPDAGFGGR